jgi:hypothetical protein
LPSSKRRRFSSRTVRGDGELEPPGVVADQLHELGFVKLAGDEVTTRAVAWGAAFAGMTGKLKRCAASIGCLRLLRARFADEDRPVWSRMGTETDQNRI